MAMKCLNLRLQHESKHSASTDQIDKLYGSFVHSEHRIKRTARTHGGIL